jgi:hypothetical protein
LYKLNKDRSKVRRNRSLTREARSERKVKKAVIIINGCLWKGHEYRNQETIGFGLFRISQDLPMLKLPFLSPQLQIHN